MKLVKDTDQIQKKDQEISDEKADIYYQSRKYESTFWRN